MSRIHKPLNEQVVLITGATSGIGRQSATALQRDGSPMLERFSNDRLGPAIGTVMNQQVRPVLRDFFNEDIAPTVIHILQESAANALKVPTRPDVSKDVVINADNVSKGAVLGSREAAVDLGLLTKDESITPGARAFIWGVVAAMVLVGLVAIESLIVLTMVAFRLRRR